MIPNTYNIARVLEAIEQEHDDELANVGCDPDEDWCAYDQFGSNVDDAFEGGVDVGRARFAKELRALLSVPKIG